MGRACGHYLIEALAIDNPAVQAETARLLGELAIQEAVPGLLGLLDAEDHFLVQHAGLALGKLGDPRAVPGLLVALDGTTFLGDRLAMLVALGHLGDERAVPALEALLQNPEPHLQVYAAGALGRLGRNSGLAVALAHAESPIRTLRWAAFESLGAIGGEQAEQALEKAEADSVAYRSLRKSRLKTLTIPEKVQALSTDLGREKDVRRWAIRELGRLDDPAAKALLTANLVDARSGRIDRLVAAQLVRRGEPVETEAPW